MNRSHAKTRAQKLEADLLELVAMPSITGTDQEVRIARHIHAKFQQWPYFQSHPAHLQLITKKPPDIPHPLEAVFALVKAARPTRKTILLIAHFDVVAVHNYGALKELAFDPPGLAAKLGAVQLPDAARQDLESGEYLFGRGVMDMKLGLALEMDLLGEFSRQTDLYEVNIALLAVGDEENNNAGMRQGVEFLHQGSPELDLDIACVIDTEPSDAGSPGTREQMVFLGTTGKLLPFFYILGLGSHAGNYYQGLSASLLAANLQRLIEANPDLSDADHGEVTAPPLGLGLELRHREYSVTLPDRAATYFNYFALAKTPSTVLKEMTDLAREAVTRTQARLNVSYREMQTLGYSGAQSSIQVRVLRYEELYAEIQAAYDGNLDRVMADYAKDLPEDADVRERGFLLVEKLLEFRQDEDPIVIAGLLPPFLPPRTSLGDSPKERALQEAVVRLQDYALTGHGTPLKKAVYFGGICDLSYAGCDFKTEELERVARNIPGWGAVYDIPLKAVQALDAPVINLGPRGRDAHKMTERLEKDYAFRVLPDLIRFLIRNLSYET